MATPIERNEHAVCDLWGSRHLPLRDAMVLAGALRRGNPTLQGRRSVRGHQAVLQIRQRAWRKRKSAPSPVRAPQVGHTRS